MCVKTSHFLLLFRKYTQDTFYKQYGTGTVILWHVHFSTVRWTWFEFGHKKLCFAEKYAKILFPRKMIKLWVFSFSLVSLLNRVSLCWKLRLVKDFITFFGRYGTQDFASARKFWHGIFSHFLIMHRNFLEQIKYRKIFTKLSTRCFSQNISRNFPA